jgi:bidirectional [NiFe] hydrogenase diaphorase subunit
VPPAAKPASSAHPSGDRRFKLLEVTMKRHQFQGSALIEVLHAAQELFGYLDHDVLYFVAHGLKLPPSKVYGVATFYHFFSLKPLGGHTCVVCTGTACYVKGADRLIAAIEERAQIDPGQTTPDGKLSLLTARCLGACGVAPAVVLDGVVHGHQTPEGVLTAIGEWLPHASVGGWLPHGPAGTT